LNIDKDLDMFNMLLSMLVSIQLINNAILLEHLSFFCNERNTQKKKKREIPKLANFDLTAKISP